MPAFTIETSFDVPHYRHKTYQAETLEEALAMNAADDDWSGQKADFETCGDDRVTGAWAGEEDHVGADLMPALPSSKAEQMEALLRGAIEAWPEFDNDDEISGSDAVEFLGGFLEDAKKVLGMSTAGQDERACSEGWGLFDRDGKLEVQADSDSDKFVRGGVSYDDEALAFVSSQAAAGSEYHAAALARVGQPA